MSAAAFERRLPPRGAVSDRDLWKNTAAWDAFPPFHLVDATSGAPARHETEIRAAWDRDAVHMRVRCRDHEIWATHLVRDAPLWEEEVVEWFVAAGARAPSYAELEWNPHGTLFDAWVDNPDGDRRTMRVDRGWTASGLRWAVAVDRGAATWTVLIRLPWTALGREGPSVLRTNVYRVERPSGGEPEFQAWSPTLATPADFHRPERFGLWIPDGA